MLYLTLRFFVLFFRVFFCLSFQQFDYEVSGWGFLWVYCLGDLISYLNLEGFFFVVVFLSFNKLGEFLHYFVKYFFSPILSSLLELQ